MKRRLSQSAVEQDERATAEICDHLEDLAGHRGQYYPRDMRQIADPLGAKTGNLSERLARRSEWTIGEVLALADAGLLPGALRLRIIEALGAVGGDSAAEAVSREVTLDYSRARNAIIVLDRGREVGVARIHSRLSDATTKLVRGICKIAGGPRWGSPAQLLPRSTTNLRNHEANHHFSQGTLPALPPDLDYAEEARRPVCRASARRRE